MAGSLRMYAIAAIPNSDILDDTTTGGPALPTINELNHPTASKVQWIWKGRHGVFFLPNGEFVTQVKLHRHLQPLLADPASTASDVYMVTQSETIGNNPIGSLYHCSFYTQAVFYHLSAPVAPGESLGNSQNTAKFRNVVCTLKREDFSNAVSEDYARSRAPSTRKLLVAYKVGQTDYEADQILQIAEWSVRQLSKYGLLGANCQHFTTTMVRRTVMRVGDRSAFAGTAPQIVDWDLRRGFEPHTNSIERGFTVAPPLPGMQCLPEGQCRLLITNRFHT